MEAHAGTPPLHLSMTFLPIVERELRVRARQRATARFRVGGALAAIVFVGALLAVADLSSANRNGSQLFGFLAGLVFAYCVFEGARNTADCLSEEKRAGTLGLLFLTDLRGYDIVLGKLIATSLNSFYALLAVLPPLAVPLVLGGVTGGEFWRVVLVLMATLAISVTSGLVVSATVRAEGKAWLLTLGMIALVLPGTIGAFASAFDVPYQANPAAFWYWLLPVPAVACLQLVAACVTLPRTWRQSWEQRQTPSPAGRWPKQSMQRLQTRQARCPGLLSSNPVLWLATRWAGERGLLWTAVLLAGAAGVALLLWVQPPGEVIPGLLAAIAALHLLLATGVAWLACHAAVEARQSGMLELLLTSPVTVPQIVEGHLDGLKLLLRRPLLLLFATECGGVLSIGLGQSGASGLVVVVPTALVIAVAIADLHAAAAMGLWAGLRSPRVGPAFARTVLFVLALPLVGTMICVCLMPVTLLIKDLLFVSHARAQLLKHFRAAAAGEPLTAPESRIQQMVRTRAQQLPRVLDP
jgi:hypothetical protein